MCPTSVSWSRCPHAEIGESLREPHEYQQTHETVAIRIRINTGGLCCGRLLWEAGRGPSR
jgi:hypothetical protein